MTLSYIEEFEIDEAKELIKSCFDFELPRLIREDVLVKIYVRAEETTDVTTKTGETVKIYVPDSTIDYDKAYSFAALVLAISDKINEEDLSYRVGDFIAFPRFEGEQVVYKGHVFHVLPARKVYSILKEPQFLKRKK